MSYGHHYGFSWALGAIKDGEHWRRSGWRPGSYVFLQGPATGFDGFIAIHTHDDRRAPWTPSRCDLLENDWMKA